MRARRITAYVTETFVRRHEKTLFVLNNSPEILIGTAAKVFVSHAVCLVAGVAQDHCHRAGQVFIYFDAHNGVA